MSLIRALQKLLPPQVGWVTGNGTPTDEAYQYFRDLDQKVRAPVAIYLVPVTVANLPTNAVAGHVAFASNGRKNGEGAGNGTGVLVFHDGTAWRACDTGATAAA